MPFCESPYFGSCIHTVLKNSSDLCWVLGLNYRGCFTRTGILEMGAIGIGVKGLFGLG